MLSLDMRKTFKYRIDANKETLTKTEEWIELCRVLYNCILAERIYAYKMQNKTLSCFNQIKELPVMKQENPEYYKVNSAILQQVVERVDFSYRIFFSKIKKCKGKVGLPRFKSRNRYNSFTLKQSGWQLKDKYLIINNLGTFKLHLSRPIKGNIKTITIKKSSTNKWYVYFSCDNVPEIKLPYSNKKIGIDVGIKSYLTDSKGNKIGNPKYLKNSLKKLRIKQRRLSRAKRGSKRRNNIKLQVSKSYEKVFNQRKDFQHKLANRYINNYGTIVIEKLQITNMAKNHKLARDINDCAWGSFFELLKYKAEEAGREVIQINSYNTSKICSECGEINQELKLSDRNWLCKSCGTYHDRDFNAAKNIERVGQTQQELTYGNSQSVSCKSLSN